MFAKIFKGGFMAGWTGQPQLQDDAEGNPVIVDSVTGEKVISVEEMRREENFMSAIGFAKVMKSNPYHDKTGKFTSKDKATPETGGRSPYTKEHATLAGKMLPGLGEGAKNHAFQIAYNYTGDIKNMDKVLAAYMDLEKGRKAKQRKSDLEMVLIV